MSLSADERNAIIVVVAGIGTVVGRISIGLHAAALFGVVAVFSLRPKLVVLALVLFIGARADQMADDLRPLTARPVTHETLRLASDPKPTDWSWRAEASLGPSRVVIHGRGPASSVLRRSSSGDELVVSGTLRGSEPRSGWALSRRVVGRVEIQNVHSRAPAGGPVGLATSLREHLTHGARSLGAERRALFTGLVFGDDREQGPITADNFRAAGLGHLLAVSGQNVLFVLLLATPVLSRMRSLALRLAGTILVLVAFGLVTRFEPSVSRALLMAAVAAVGSARGEPAEAVRLLPIAVIGLLLIDPLLGFSLAFQLSVAATLGLVVLSPRIDSLLVGPDIIRLPMSATMGAQLAVAPLLMSTFGSVSVVAIPANVLAGPAAAFVMMWGLTGGALAGLAPDVVARAVHLPTRLAIWWIDGVAGVCAELPVGSFERWHLSAIVFGLAARVVGRRRWMHVVGIAVAICALTLPVVLTPRLAPGHHRLAAGLMVVRSTDGHDIVVLESPRSVADSLEALRGARLGRIDLLVVTDGSREMGRHVRVLKDRFDVTETWAPPGHQVPGARVTPADGGFVGPLQVEVGASGDVSVAARPIG